jgi:hypothetical protein
MKITKSILILLTILLCFSWACIAQGERDYAKTPIFFVHSHPMTAGSWNAMISNLMNSDYRRTYLKAIQLRRNNASNVLAPGTRIAPDLENFVHP